MANAIKTYTSPSKEFTQRLGEVLAKRFVPGDVVLLKGDLGAGKTTFTGGVAKGLGIEESVISPTFNIMKCYFNGRIPLYHIDAYRLEGQPIEIGLDEYIEGDGVCLIEWPMYIEKLLPDEYLEISITHQGDNHRQLVLKGVGERFEMMVSSLEEVQE
ncbi:MAG: tRNA (adenosine(37)-N6)-threonylcarbamoyltransferase complex ATPase subunit type 1 TsaE [Candidatus Enteromonas sp.]